MFQDSTVSERHMGIDRAVEDNGGSGAVGGNRSCSRQSWSQSRLSPCSRPALFRLRCTPASTAGAAVAWVAACDALALVLPACDATVLAAAIADAVAAAMSGRSARQTAHVTAVGSFSNVHKGQIHCGCD